MLGLAPPPEPIARWATALLDALLPPRCLACPAAVDVPGRLCPGCWAAVDFITPPYCAACGFPFDHDEGPDALCGGCARDQPAFSRARAAVRYNGVGRDLVLGFKHGDRTHGAPAFAQWLERAGSELLADADVIAPVPLHRWRLFLRRYNQSALLARALGQAGGRRVVPDLLVRRRNTPSQGRMNAEARARNVRGAFAVPARRRDRLAGQRVLLIDDVFTSGATAEACARVLLRNGAAGVDVLTLARVVRPRS